MLTLAILGCKRGDEAGHVHTSNTRPGRAALHRICPRRHATDEFGRAAWRATSSIDAPGSKAESAMFEELQAHCSDEQIVEIRTSFDGGTS
jgi:hypothetical protein